MLGKLLWVSAGHMSLVLGVLGALLPILPATPFVLLACVCYERGSEKFHRAILANRWCSPMIRNWQSGKSISLRAKILAVSMLAASTIYSMAVLESVPVRTMLAVIVVSVGAFLISRPMPKKGT